MPEPVEDSMTIILSNQLSGVAATKAIEINTTVSTMLATGMTNQAIKDVLLNDLQDGGRIFGSLKNQFKATVRNGVTYSANTSAMNEFKQAGVKEFRWETRGENICDDCAMRHDEVGTLEEIANIGLPQSGFSVCGSNCKCQLVAHTYTEK